MEIADIKRIIFDASRVRFPILDKTKRMPDQIDDLIEYIAKTAIVRGELEEGWLYASEALSLMRHSYDQIEPDAEVLRGRTGKDGVKEAKKAADPIIVASMEEAERLCEQCGRQIARLEMDYAAASRTYSLMSGVT